MQNQAFLTWVPLALFLVACGSKEMPPQPPAPEPQAAAPDRAVPMAADGIQVLKTACEQAATADAKNTAKPAECKLTKDDCEALAAVQAEHDKTFAQALVLAPLARLGVTTIMGPAVGGTVDATPVCTDVECKIPVLITDPDATNTTCQATLPFFKYCVAKLPAGASPSDKAKREMTFYLVREDANANRVPIDPKDGYQFAGKVKGKGRYADLGRDLSGLELLVEKFDATEQKYKPKDFDKTKDYFKQPKSAIDGLTFEWKVGGGNTFGMPGRIPNGILSVPVVQYKKGSDEHICRPLDPIIVNAAN